MPVRPNLQVIETPTRAQLLARIAVLEAQLDRTNEQVDRLAAENARLVDELAQVGFGYGLVRETVWRLRARLARRKDE